MPTIPANWLTSMPSGARYHFLINGITKAFARDSNLSKVKIEADWNTHGGLIRDFFGQAAYLPGTAANRLTRTLPLTDAYAAGVRWIDRMDMDGVQGERPDPAHVGSAGPPALGWPAFDGFIQFTLTFTNREYDVFTDAEADAFAAVKNGRHANSCVPEQTRFLRITRRQISEMRRVPGGQVEVYDDGIGPGPHPAFATQPTGEIGAVPSYQVELIAESIFWPAENYPELGTYYCANCVNNDWFYLGGWFYEPGTLLYKGPASDLTPYRWIDGKFYYDIPHLFGFRPYGWNTHRLPALTTAGRQWYPTRVRLRGGGIGPAPFSSADFRLIFTPYLPT